MLVVFSVQVLFAAWGVVTGIGLFQLRVWSRWSILVFSALLAFIGVFAALSTSFVNMPTPENLSAHAMTGIKFGLVIFWAILAFLGAFWLYYFNRLPVRTRFGEEPDAREPGGRPVSISIIAWFLIVGSVFCIITAPFRLPSMLFGITLTGWPAGSYYLAFGLWELWIGIGLPRLKPLSRILAIAVCGFGIANTLTVAVLPGFSDRMHAFMQSMPVGLRSTPDYGFAYSPAFVCLSAAVCAVPMWFLVAGRTAFEANRDADGSLGTPPVGA
jgi:hypothetical protein